MPLFTNNSPDRDRTLAGKISLKGSLVINETPNEFCSPLKL
ncbi:hypothetical protein [Capnocytophaga endodontalis]|nr:hypothetical protein [Capnocytophaga endodontalis]